MTATTATANQEQRFFSALVMFEGDESPMECVFATFEDEDSLTREDGLTDDDIFHYGMSLERAISIVGKETKETGEDFKIIEVI